MNAQQLKNSILQEAIEGRLVPQDPNDEPASVLLEKIRKEKARLVKEGKLKKKDLEEILFSEDEKPFEIPKSWEWVRLKAIFSLQAGKNVTAADINSEQNGIYKYPCFGGNGLRGYVRDYNTEGVYPLIGRQGALCGNVNMASGKFWATEHAVVTDGYNMTVVKWQYYFLIALNLNRYATATAQPGLAVSNIIEKLIPLPPLAEQKRIVAKIEELLPKIEEYGKAQEALDKLNEDLPERLKKSILQEAIEGRLVSQDPNDEPASILLDRIRKEKVRLVKEGKLKKKDLEKVPIEEDEIPFIIPENWEWCKLGWLVDFGKSSSTSSDNIDVESWLLDLEDIEKDTGRLLIKKRKKNVRCLSDKRKFYKDNVLYSKLRPYLNKVIVADEDGYCTTEILAFDFGLIYNKYAQYYLMSPYFVNYAMSGSFGTKMPRLGSKHGNDAPFPIPPLAEQKRIVAKIEQLFHEIDKLRL